MSRNTALQVRLEAHSPRKFLAKLVAVRGCVTAAKGDDDGFSKRFARIADRFFGVPCTQSRLTCLETPENPRYERSRL